MPTPEELFIENIYSERAQNSANTRTLANTVRSLINDTLAGDKYIGELLQNADDAGSASVEFILSGHYLIFKHKGRHFDQNDIKGICDAASPDRAKVLASDQIGNKGIGFKAVFSMASTVIISSQAYCFRFDETYAAWQGKPEYYPWQIIPIWTDRAALPQEVKHFCNDESVTFIFRVRDEQLETITQDIKKLSSGYLLFLRHIKQMLIIQTDQKNTTLEKSEIVLQAPKPVFKLKNTKDDFTISEITAGDNRAWYVYKRNCALPSDLQLQLKAAKHIPEKYKTWTSLPISIALLVQDNKLVPAKEGHNVFCYLPTRLDFGFKFILNAEFLLDSSRMQLRDDGIANAWNSFILESVMTEHVRFLSTLAVRSEQWPFIFEVLSLTQKIPAPFENACEKAFEEAIKSLALVMNLAKSQIRQIASTVIDKYGFINQFGDEVLQKKCANPEIRNSELLADLGANYFQSADIIKVMQEPWFLASLNNPKRNKAFIEFLSALYEQLSKAEAKEKLKQAFQAGSFILSSRDQLRRISEVYFPDETLKYLIAKFSFVDVVHAMLYQSKSVSWLVAMGLQTLQLENIIDMANKASEELISFTLHLAKQVASLDANAQPKLKKLKVTSSSGKVISASEAYMPDAWRPQDPIEQFVGPLNDVVLHPNYVSPEETQLYREFLAFLGVHQSITISNLSTVTEAVIKTNDANKLIAFTQCVFKQFFTGHDLKTRQALFNAIKTLKVVNQKGEIVSATDCYLADIYGPEQRLETVVPLLSYLAVAYIKSDEEIGDWTEFFRQLGVKATLSVKVHKDSYREELIKQDASAAAYFMYLKTTNADLYPWATSNYMYQHRLNGGYVQIEFSEALVTTRVLWELLIKHWAQFGDLIKEVKYITARSETTVPSNIHYLTALAIKKAYGDEHQPSEYYGQEIQEKLGAYASEFKIADITQGLNTKQLRTLGFKADLSLDTCQHLLQTIAANHNYQQDFEKIIYFYQHVLWHLTNSMEYEFSADLWLPNLRGQFQPASSLYYIVDGHLPHINNPQMIKKPEVFSSEQFQRLCRAFKVTLILYNELLPTLQTDATPSQLKQHIEARLVYIIYLETHKQDWTGENQRLNGARIFLQIKNKLEQLQFHCAEVIHINYKQVLAEPIDIWIDKVNQFIFHCPHQSLDIQDQQKLYQFFHEYFELKCSETDFISVMTLTEERLRKKYRARMDNFTLDDILVTARELVERQSNANAITGEKNKIKRAKILGPAEDGSFSSKEEESYSVQNMEIIDEEPNAPSKFPVYGKRLSIPKGASTAPNTTQAASISTSSYGGVAKQGGFFSARYSKEQRKQIGYYGEEAVYNHLFKSAEEKYGSAYIKSTDQGFVIQKDDYEKTVHWLNKMNESNKPYDFEVIVTKSGRRKLRHFEVKTSTSSNEDSIEISYSAGEWQQMLADEKAAVASHRLFIVKAHINDKGELALAGINKKNLVKEIEQGQARVVDFKRVIFK